MVFFIDFDAVSRGGVLALKQVNSSFQSVGCVVMHSASALEEQELLNQYSHSLTVFFGLIEKNHTLRKQGFECFDTSKLVGFLAAVASQGDEVASALAELSEVVKVHGLDKVALHVEVYRNCSSDIISNRI